MKHRTKGWRLSALLIAAAATLTACGPGATLSEDEARDTAVTYIKALGTGDRDAACEISVHTTDREVKFVKTDAVALNMCKAEVDAIHSYWEAAGTLDRATNPAPAQMRESKNLPGRAWAVEFPDIENQADFNTWIVVVLVEGKPGIAGALDPSKDF